MKRNSAEKWNGTSMGYIEKNDVILVENIQGGILLLCVMSRLKKQTKPMMMIMIKDKNVCVERKKILRKKRAAVINFLFFFLLQLLLLACNARNKEKISSFKYQSEGEELFFGGNPLYFSYLFLRVW